MTKNEFVYTTAIKKLRKLKKRKKVIQGGTSAGKTFGILPVLIDTAAKNPLLEISVVSESVPHLRRGALKDFLKIMKITNRYIDANYNRTLLTYTFANGSYIEFFSADQEEKVRGARRNILYMNECNNMRFDIYHQLSIRTSGDIYLDYNPSLEFWCHTELIGEKDVDFLILTYKDNEALSDSIVSDIESARDKAKKSEYWANWWLVYGLGQVGKLQGVIYDNYEIVKDIPEGARLEGYGQDYGYTNDPTAIVAYYKYNNTFVIDEVCYSTGMLNSDIISILKELDRADVIADSAEPKSNEEIRRAGINIKGCVKGKDSINYGISLIQNYRFLVTERSTNVIKELRRYMWNVDKDGKSLNIPVDKDNHALDAMRYICSEKLTNKGSAKFSSRTKPKRRNKRL